MILTGTATIAGKSAGTDIATGLQTAIRQALSAAGVTYQPTVTASSHSLTFNSGQSGFEFTVAFPSPVRATGGSTGLSLSSPAVQFTFDATQPAVQLQRHVDVSVKDSNDPSFQALGLASSPTKLLYATAPGSGIELDFFVNDVEIPVSIAVGDMTWSTRSTRSSRRCRPRST